MANSKTSKRFSILVDNIHFSEDLQANLSWRDRDHVQSQLTANVSISFGDIDAVLVDCPAMMFLSDLVGAIFLSRVLMKGEQIILIPETEDFIRIQFLDGRYSVKAAYLAVDASFSSIEFEEELFSEFRKLEGAFLKRYPNHQDIITLTHSVIVL